MCEQSTEAKLRAQRFWAGVQSKAWMATQVWYSQVRRYVGADTVERARDARWAHVSTSACFRARLSVVVRRASAPRPPRAMFAQFGEAVHDGISCDGCGMSPLRGVRYRCAMCPNFDLCTSCLTAAEANLAQPGRMFGDVPAAAPPSAALHAARGHLFLRVPTPASFSTADSWLLGSRADFAHPGVACGSCSGPIRAWPRAL